MVFLECRNPTDAFGAFTGFGGIEALPDFALAIGVVITIVDARFIDIDDLTRHLRL